MRDSRVPTTALLIGLALLIAAGHCVWFGDHIADDAFITMRYARNLAAGAGPVFNRGERVEGYTNFLWMLVLSLVARLGIDLPRFAVWLGGALSLATILVLAALVWREVSAFAGAATALITASCGAFVGWACSGMEVGLFSFLIVVALSVQLRGPRTPLATSVLGILLALATLTRPEGVLVFASLAGLRIAESRSGGRASLRRELFLWGCYVLPVGLHELWRMSYYGRVLPNTFAAKVGWSWAQVARGLDYSADFATVYAVLLLAAVLAVARPTRFVLTLAIPFGLYTVYIVLVGGDSFPLFRFFAPVLPLLCALAAIGVTRTAEGRAGAAAATVLAMVLLVAVPSWRGAHWRKIVHDSHDVAVWSKLGVWLDHHLEAGQAVALNPVGAVGYYCRHVVIDMLGITDARIAAADVPLGNGSAGHEKADAAYVLMRRPTYIFVGVNHPMPARWLRPHLEPVYDSDRELLARPALLEDYEPVIIDIGGVRVSCLRRR